MPRAAIERTRQQPERQRKIRQTDDLAGVLKPLAVPKMPLDEPPPRESRFGSPLQLSKVHWVRPELVVEVTYLTWTGDNLLRQVSYQGQREDKEAGLVVRPVPHPPRRSR